MNEAETTERELLQELAGQAAKDQADMILIEMSNLISQTKEIEDMLSYPERELRDKELARIWSVPCELAWDEWASLVKSWKWTPLSVRLAN